MPQTLREILSAVALLGVIVVLAFVAGLSPSQLAMLAVSTSLFSWSGRAKRRRITEFWTAVWQIRCAEAHSRKALIEALEPESLRIKVAEELVRDGSDSRQGDIEQFPFPNGLRRFHSRLYWFCWVLSLGSLVVSATAKSHVVWASVLLLIGCAFAGLAWRLSQREAILASIIEVTPSRISELRADGATQTFMWSELLILRNEPRRQRAMLQSDETTSGVELDYRRMGFSRLIDLVVKYGQFVEVESPPPSS